MSDSLQVPNVPSNTQALYKLLGFNNNKRDREWADINGDGKTVEAEAKFYLQNYTNISPAVRKKFALTDADRKVLSECFQEAFEKASAIEDRFRRGFVIFNLSIKMAKAQLFKEALEAARTLGNLYDRSFAFRLIASMMADAGQDKNEVIAVLKEALETARLVHYAELKAYAIAETALALGKTGIDKNEISTLFHEALEAINAIEYLAFKARTINFVNSEMAKAGFNKNERDKMFIEAGIKPPK